MFNTQVMLLQFVLHSIFFNVFLLLLLFPFYFSPFLLYCVKPLIAPLPFWNNGGFPYAILYIIHTHTHAHMHTHICSCKGKSPLISGFKCIFIPVSFYMPLLLELRIFQKLFSKNKFKIHSDSKIGIPTKNKIF
jgi:hypothetical protein